MYERLRELLRTAPFVPFRIYLNDGRAFDIHHPEFMALGRATVHVVRAGEDDTPDDVAYLHVRNITSMELIHEAQGQS